MATSDPNDTDQKTLSLNEIVALAARLAEHADGIENLAAREMAHDMASAARGIDKLIAGIQRAIDSTTDEVCRNHLRELLGGAPSTPLFVKVDEINGDVVTLIKERIAFDEVIGDDDVEKADALRELRQGGVTRIGGGASPLYRLTKVGGRR